MSSLDSFALGCGWDYCGQTGVHSTPLDVDKFKAGQNITSFCQLHTFDNKKLKSVNGGYWHSAVCTEEDGALYVFGYNEVRTIK